jgi:CelD/BcsL family acetyltransferase involved in cellulose biosynthesis
MKDAVGSAPCNDIPVNRSGLPTVRLLRDTAELERVRHAWPEVCPSSCVTPTQDYIWYMTCAETLGGQARLAVLALEAENRLVALAPLMRSAGVFNGYELLNLKALGEPSDLLYTHPSALNTLFEYVARMKQPIKLGRIRADTPTVAAIERAFRGKGLVLASERASCPYISLEGLTTDPERSLPGRLRSDLRRAQRKADTMGSASFEIVRPASAREFLPLYERVLKVESAGWKGRAGCALSSDTLHAQFFRRYGIRAAEKGILRLAFMHIDSAVVAIQFAVQTGSRFWVLKIGYDEQYAACSPGNLLMLETLRYAWRQELMSYEFMGRSEPWTRRWTTLERPTVRIDACPYNTKGIFALAGKLARRVWLEAGRGLLARQ